MTELLAERCQHPALSVQIHKQWVEWDEPDGLAEKSTVAELVLDNEELTRDRMVEAEVCVCCPVFRLSSRVLEHAHGILTMSSATH